MHTEHLQNVEPARVIAGWLVAVALSSLIAFVLVALGMFRGEASDALWSTVAVLIGFWAGGFFTGFRAMRAAILHGIAIGMTSLVAWFVLNAVVSLLSPDFTWARMTPTLAVGLVLGQMAAAVIGALMGYNMALRGRPTLEEHPPEGVA